MTFQLFPSISFFNEFALRCETETCLQAQWASLRWGEVLAKSHSLGTYIEYIIFYQMAPSKYTWHISRVHKHVLMLVNILVQYLPKPELVDLAGTSPHLRDAH